MTILLKLLGLHRHTLSFPQMRKIDGRRVGEFQICTTCAKEFRYDFKRMERVA